MATSKIKFWQVLLGIIIICLAVILIFVIWQNPTRSKTFIDVLRILISWPAVILILGLLFGYHFRSEISRLLQNISIKLPGGTEISASQLPPPSGETEKKEAPPEPASGVLKLTPEEQKVIRTHIESLTKEASTAKQEKENLIKTAVDLLSKKDSDIKYWWFMYLSLFLVPTTKNVLWWFMTRIEAPTKEYYHLAWKDVVLDVQQREIMFMVLLHHGLIEEKGPVIQITQNGRDFLTFINWQPIPSQ